MPHKSLLRFVAEWPSSGCLRRAGIFAAAYDLRRSDRCLPELSTELNDLLTWFGADLPIPGRFARSRRPHAHPVAVSWFKPSAHEHVRKARRLVQILAACGVSVDELRTSRPGYVVFEDEFQVVAEPFSDTPT